MLTSPAGFTCQFFPDGIPDLSSLLSIASTNSSLHLRHQTRGFSETKLCFETKKIQAAKLVFPFLFRVCFSKPEDTSFSSNLKQ
jgi:hypothetical protein